MKSVKFATLVMMLLLFSGLFFIVETVPVGSAQEENHCFTCHTNPRKLIEINREIAKTNLQKPGASSETEGEG